MFINVDDDVGDFGLSKFPNPNDACRFCCISVDDDDDDPANNDPYAAANAKGSIIGLIIKPEPAGGNPIINSLPLWWLAEFVNDEWWWLFELPFGQFETAAIVDE